RFFWALISVIWALNSAVLTLTRFWPSAMTRLRRVCTSACLARAWLVSTDWSWIFFCSVRRARRRRASLRRPAHDLERIGDWRQRWSRRFIFGTEAFPEGSKNGTTEVISAQSII